MLLLVAAAAGAALPHLARRHPQLVSGDEDDEDEIDAVERTIHQLQIEARERGRSIKLPKMPLLLRDIWTAALLLFTVITFSTFFISKVWQAIVAVSLIGICWAVACWVPFAIIMEVNCLLFTF